MDFPPTGCPSGTSLQPSNFGQTGSQPRRANFCNGKNPTNCMFCAPAGGQVYSVPSGNFWISPRCTLVGDTNGNSEWWGGFGYGTITGSWSGQDVQFTYSNAYSGIGYLEVCSQNGYASFTVQIGNTTTKPPAACPASVPQNGGSCTGTPNNQPCGYDLFCCPGTTQCLNTTQAFCMNGQWQLAAADPLCPACPASAPQNGGTCNAPSNQACGYDLFCCPGTTQCLNTTQAFCVNGHWQLAAADPLCPACPASAPQNGGSCNAPSNQACGYDLFCCPGTTQCLNTTQAFCVNGHWQLAAADPAPCPVCNSLPQAFTLPSTMSNFSVWQDPRIRGITCGSATSACKVCPKPTTTPIPAGSWSVDVNCPSGTTAQYKSANTFGFGSWTISWPTTGYAGTISKPNSQWNYGWIKTEFCDSNNAYGSWILLY